MASTHAEMLTNFKNYFKTANHIRKYYRNRNGDSNFKDKYLFSIIIIIYYYYLFYPCGCTILCHEII